MIPFSLIKILHIAFVASLALVTLRLFIRSLTSEKIRRSSPLQRAELFLRVSRDGVPYLRIPLKKNHYLIGRGPECEILLKGEGIPFYAGEISWMKDDYYYTKAVNDHRRGGLVENSQSQNMTQGAKIAVADYMIEIARQ